MQSLITRIHETVRESIATRRGATMRPEDVPHGTHKEYPRMPRIALPEPQQLSSALSKAITMRRSLDAAVSTRALSAEELGTLLGLALGKKQGSFTRNYPSGGALYPIETYLAGNVLEGKHPGIFHYHPSAHALEHLWDVPSDFSTRDIAGGRDTPAGSLLLIFTAVWERSSAKYGNLAYLHGAIEAGHMAQNILLVSTAMNFSARPLAGFNDEKIIATLDIDEKYEQPIYTVVASPSSV